MVLGSINEIHCKSGQHVVFPFEASRVQEGSNAFLMDSNCVHLCPSVLAWLPPYLFTTKDRAVGSTPPGGQTGGSGLEPG